MHMNTHTVQAAVYVSDHRLVVSYGQLIGQASQAWTCQCMQLTMD